MAIIGRRRKRGLSTTQIIACGFLISMIIGMVLLMLPVSSKDGTFTNPVDLRRLPQLLQYVLRGLRLYRQRSIGVYLDR